MNLSELWNKYPDEKSCLDEIVRLRGLSCCSKLYKVKNRKAYACSCGKQIHPLKGTIFEGSSTPLRLWFYAIFLMANTRSGISAMQLHRELGVTYKTAWRMFKNIRQLMADDNSPLTGTVEVDETYVGGKRRDNSWYPNRPPKDVVFGMVERGGRAKLRHVPNNGKWTLLAQIQGNVSKDTQIYSDDYPSYTNLPQYGYKHASINHSEGKHRDGDIYTQNIENVWSHLKRGIRGVYRQVSSKYLQSYCNEFAFRYNNRHRQGKMFELMLGNINKS